MAITIFIFVFFFAEGNYHQLVEGSPVTLSGFGPELKFLIRNSCDSLKMRAFFYSIGRVAEDLWTHGQIMRALTATCFLFITCFEVLILVNIYQFN